MSSADTLGSCNEKPALYVVGRGCTSGTEKPARRVLGGADVLPFWDVPGSSTLRKDVSKVLDDLAVACRLVRIVRELALADKSGPCITAFSVKNIKADIQPCMANTHTQNAVHGIECS